MTWIKNLQTGVKWEVTDEKAAELLRWYPEEYAPADPPAGTKEAGETVETKTKKGQITWLPEQPSLSLSQKLDA
jgi:hypothetical protein